MGWFTPPFEAATMYASGCCHYLNAYLLVENTKPNNMPLSLLIVSVAIACFSVPFFTKLRIRLHPNCTGH